MNAAFWSGRRVFLTGHTGFKGAWLSLWLHRLGAKVMGYALEPPTQPSLYDLAHVKDTLTDIRADIRDLPAITAAIREFRPEIVIHMAAQPILRASYQLPIETYDTNVMGTVKVMEAVRATPSVRALISVTSDKCYENRETIWAYRESDPMGGYDPYSSSKGCAELVTAAYARSFFQPAANGCSVASVRAGNVIGGGDWAPDRLMADLMRGLMAGENVTIRNPHALRPWQHVLEPLSGYLTVAQHLIEHGPMAWEGWNFGPDSGGEQPVQAMARLTCALWGKPEAMKLKPESNAPHEAGLLKLDSTKARTCLGWRPRWNFDQSVGKTVDWYKCLAMKGDIRAFTLSQIEAYEAAI